MRFFLQTKLWAGSKWQLSFLDSCQLQSSPLNSSQINYIQFQINEIKILRARFYIFKTNADTAILVQIVMF